MGWIGRGVFNMVMSTFMGTLAIFPTLAMIEGHRLAVKSYSLQHSMSKEDLYMNMLHRIRQVVII